MKSRKAILFGLLFPILGSCNQNPAEFMENAFKNEKPAFIVSYESSSGISIQDFTKIGTQEVYQPPELAEGEELEDTSYYKTVDVTAIVEDGCNWSGWYVVKNVDGIKTLEYLSQYKTKTLTSLSYTNIAQLYGTHEEYLMGGNQICFKACSASCLVRFYNNVEDSSITDASTLQSVFQKDVISYTAPIREGYTFNEWLYVENSVSYSVRDKLDRREFDYGVELCGADNRTIKISEDGKMVDPSAKEKNLYLFCANYRKNI